jgi:hypothetical protein
MGVGIYRPGQNVFTFGIDDFIRRIVQIDADCLDLVAVSEHVGQIAAGRINDGSAFK